MGQDRDDEAGQDRDDEAGQDRDPGSDTGIQGSDTGIQGSVTGTRAQSRVPGLSHGYREPGLGTGSQA